MGMSGNGIDLGAIYGLLGAVAADVRNLQRDVGEIRRELGGKADKDDVLSLRQAVTDYHSSVLGHGILISELDARLRRVEQHLNLPPAA